MRAGARNPALLQRRGTARQIASHDALLPAQTALHHSESQRHLAVPTRLFGWDVTCGLIGLEITALIWCVRPCVSYRWSPGACGSWPGICTRAMGRDDFTNLRGCSLGVFMSMCVWMPRASRSYIWDKPWRCVDMCGQFYRAAGRRMRCLLCWTQENTFSTRSMICPLCVH